MPNKSNPDVIEVMRAKYAVIAGHYSELENLISLPSGFHRDLQLSKRSLILSTWVFEAASISKKSRLLPSVISLVFEHSLHGLGVGLESLSQLRHFAKILAIVVLPTPLVPEKINAWCNLS